MRALHVRPRRALAGLYCLASAGDELRPRCLDFQVAQLPTAHSSSLGSCVVRGLLGTMALTPITAPTMDTAPVARSDRTASTYAVALLRDGYACQRRSLQCGGCDRL
ncbi:hypothetical protein BD626DRAFT_84283 [Schizophyllum amplum]|uniref:Uncharacterized protein n=1 Tax=Schizophyllum amplum TaxID=97359 RepID=A0A550C8X8_9AGAR|nr:hypothetical protein BD626DRAFT_84283 [Auriculariopsis ampla]